MGLPVNTGTFFFEVEEGVGKWRGKSLFVEGTRRECRKGVFDDEDGECEKRFVVEYRERERAASSAGFASAAMRRGAGFCGSQMGSLWRICWWLSWWPEPN